jgi:hypothetical protein
MPCRLPVPAALLLSSLWATGCAARSSEVEGATRDERRQQIALLDQRIAAAEAELGLRPSPAPPSRYAVPPPGGDAEAQTGADGAGGVVAPQAPPPAQAPAQEAPPAVADTPMSPSQRGLGGGGACARICRSVLSICDASDRICRLADDLDDAWAQGRCEASARSCDAAERRAASGCGDC